MSALFLFFVLLTGCSGAGTGNTDAGNADQTDTDADTDGDSDGETDIGTDTPAEADTDTAAPDCDESKLPAEDVFFEFYEFCVEDNDTYLTEVRDILAPVGEENYSSGIGSSGTIGCDRETEYLFWDIPRSTSPDILCALTLLPYIETIGGGVYL